MPISNVYTNPLDESNVLLKRSTLSPSSFQAQSAPVSHLLFFFIDPGAEPQVLPSANRVDLSSQLSTAPAGTVGLSRHKRPTSRPRLPTLLAVSLFRFFFSFFFFIRLASGRETGERTCPIRWGALSAVDTTSSLIIQRVSARPSAGQAKGNTCLPTRSLFLSFSSEFGRLAAAGSRIPRPPLVRYVRYLTDQLFISTRRAKTPGGPRRSIDRSPSFLLAVGPRRAARAPRSTLTKQLRKRGREGGRSVKV